MPRRALQEDGPAPDPLAVGHRDRLRSRLRDAGELALADYELLELSLFSVVPRQDTKPLARRLLQEFGEDLPALLAASRERLMQIEGVGDAVATHIVIIGAFLGRAARQAATGRDLLSSWSMVVDYCRRIMQGLATEQFRVLFLDRKNRLIRDEVLGHGTVDHAPVYPREVMRRALELRASSLVLVHNHPSGDPTPSSADVDMTRLIVDAARTLEITVHDHLVVGRQGHASLRQLGLM